MRGALMLLVALTSCAGRGHAPVPDLAQIASNPQPAQVMSLIGRFGMAHACPVESYGDKHILTAAHVAVRMSRDYSQYPKSYVYQQGPKTGFVVPSGDHLPSQYVDLAWFEVQMGDIPNYNPLAKDVAIGDEVYWFEYDGDLQKQKRKSKVVQVLAGHIVTKRPFAFGASGGCIFNEADEVVGIPIWRMHTGVGVMLTEKWSW